MKIFVVLKIKCLIVSRLKFIKISLNQLKIHMHMNWLIIVKIFQQLSSLISHVFSPTLSKDVLQTLNPYKLELSGSLDSVWPLAKECYSTSLWISNFGELEWASIHFKISCKDSFLKGQTCKMKFRVCFSFWNLTMI